MEPRLGTTPLGATPLDEVYPHPITLFMLIGIPGSGKSYLASQLLDAAPDRVLISTDAIRAQLFGADSIQGPWSRVQTEIEHQLLLAVAMARSGQLVEAIYDATNATLAQRKQAIQLARRAGFTQVIGLWLATPLATCLARNQQRQRHVPDEVILRMHDQLQLSPPKESEGFDRLLCLPE